MQKRSFSRAPGYPVRSTVGERNPANQAWYKENGFPVVEGAWSNDNAANTHEDNYIDDQPNDYAVEESTSNPTPALMQKRSFARAPGYPVRSTVGGRNPNNQDWYDENEMPIVEGAWSKANLHSSNVEKYT